jgi:hypothetical protein
VPPEMVVASGDLVVSEDILGAGVSGVVKRATFRGKPACAKVRAVESWTMQWMFAMGFAGPGTGHQRTLWMPVSGTAAASRRVR